MQKERTIKNIIFTLISQIVYIVCGFVVPKILIKGYGSETYALTTSITQFLAYITLLESGVGLVVKSVLYKPIAEKKQDEVSAVLYSTQKFFNKIALAFIVYIVFLCIFYPMTKSASVFDTSLTVSLIVIIALSTFFEYFIGMIYKLFLQADQKAYVISIIQVVTYIINAVIILILTYFEFDIRIVKLASSLIFILRPIIQAIYVKRHYKIDLKNCDKNYVIPSKRDGLSQHIAGIINSKTDVALLTIFSNMSNVAIYSVYMMIVSSIITLINSFTTGSDAMFGDMYAKGEKKELQKAFDVYESLYLLIVTIIFICTSVLIVSFVSVYTSGIEDVNYIQPLFGFLIVTAYFVQAIKSPYNALSFDAGKFKETKTGSWIESTINVILSLALVSKYGIVGVAIGTLCSVIYRGITFVVFTAKSILERRPSVSVKKILLSLIQYIVMYFAFKQISVNITSYFGWFIYAIIVFLVTVVVVGITTVIFNKNIISDIKVVLKRREK